MTIHLSVISRLVAFGVGWWMIGTGVDAIGSQSKGAASWRSETSYAALHHRQQGRLSVGLGALAMGVSVAGLKINNPTKD